MPPGRSFQRGLSKCRIGAIQQRPRSPVHALGWSLPRSRGHLRRSVAPHRTRRSPRHRSIHGRRRGARRDRGRSAFRRGPYTAHATYPPRLPGHRARGQHQSTAGGSVVEPANHLHVLLRHGRGLPKKRPHLPFVARTVPLRIRRWTHHREQGQIRGPGTAIAFLREAESHFSPSEWWVGAHATSRKGFRGVSWRTQGCDSHPARPMLTVAVAGGRSTRRRARRPKARWTARWSPAPSPRERTLTASIQGGVAQRQARGEQRARALAPRVA
jgi:hypothetical protein